MTSLLLACVVLSAWGPGSCPPVGDSVLSQTPYAHVPRSEWRTHPDEQGRFYLYRDGVQIAGYDATSGVYRDYDAKTCTWGEKRDPPWKVEVVPNFGVDLSKISKNEERCTINGREATTAEATKTIIGGPLPDDANKLRLTVIGTPTQTKPVLDDLLSVRDTVAVQAYEPTNWTVSQMGYVTTGSPTIYVQAPDGRVLHRQDTYTGATALLGAIRKARPDYDPKRDPDLTKPVTPLKPAIPDLPPWAWIVGGIVLVILLTKRS